MLPYLGTKDRNEVDDSSLQARQPQNYLPPSTNELLQAIFMRVSHSQESRKITSIKVSFQIKRRKFMPGRQIINFLEYETYFLSRAKMKKGVLKHLYLPT